MACQAPGFCAGTAGSLRKVPLMDPRRTRAREACLYACRTVSLLGRSLLPLWYLPALTKVHRPLLKILLSSQQLKKCRRKCFRGSTRLRR